MASPTALVLRAPPSRFSTSATTAASILLDHLGYTTAARRIEAAVVADVEKRDGGARSTSAVGDAIAAGL